MRGTESATLPRPTLPFMCQSRVFQIHQLLKTRNLEAGTCAGWLSARKPEVDGVTASSVSSVCVHFVSWY